MPSDEKARPQAIAHSAQLDAKFVAAYWRFVEVCLTRVFHQSDADAKSAVARMRINLEKKEDDAAKLTALDSSIAVYHDAPLQIAAILAGAAQRPLSAEELLAYEAMLGEGRDPNTRPSREQILQAYSSAPKMH